MCRRCVCAPLELAVGAMAPWPSERVIARSCMPTCAFILSKRWSEDSPICLVEVRSPYGLSPPPSSCLLFYCPRDWWCTWRGPCNWRPFLLCREITRVTSFDTLDEPFFSVHLPSISCRGLYPRAAFLRRFWSGLRVLARLWNPCPPLRDEFHS